MSYSNVATLNGMRAIIADPAKYPLASGKANSFRFVVGPAPATGYLLLLRSDLNELQGGGPFELKFAANGKEVIAKKVWILAGHRANPGGKPDAPDAAYLCKLVDRRYFLNTWGSAVRALNVRNWAGGDPNRFYIRETAKDGRTPWTWNESLRKLWEDVGGLGPFRNVAGVRAPALEDLFNAGGNPWRFLNDVLAKIGRVMSYDAAADRFEIVPLQLNTQPIDRDVAGVLQWDARPYSSPASVAPAIIRVYFAVRMEDYGTEADTTAVDNWATSMSFTWVDVPTRAAGAIAGTIQPLWASTPAVIKHRTPDTVLNLTECRTLAREMADGWLLANGADATSRAHMLLEGLHPQYLPSASIREAIIRDVGDGCMTEVCKYPGLPAVDPDFDWQAGAGGAAAENESFQAIDVGRKSLPNYPRLENLVEIAGDSAGVPAGATVQAVPSDGGKSVHYGYVRRVVAGELQRLERCWILASNEYPATRGNVPLMVGSFHMARLSGKHEHNGERLPLYVMVAGSSSDSLIQFRLKTNLNPGRFASARQIIFNSATGEYIEQEADIVVFDWFTTARGMWQAPAVVGSSGFVEGWAQKRPGKANQYDIVWMETLAWEIEGFLDYDLAESYSDPAAGVRATVLAAFEQGKHPGAKVYVRDLLQLFPRALAGAKFRATRDEHQRDEDGVGIQAFYKLVQCQQACIMATAIVDGPMCGAPNIVAGSFAVASPSPFNQLPPNPTITNPRNHHTRDAGQIWLEWNAATMCYEVTDVTRYSTTIQLDTEYTSPDLLKKQLAASVETCTEEGAFEIITTAVERECTEPPV